ncbi:hypothetical protein GmHk_07G020323 [Glycine max]|nr:hypothetical protein GmHk_07G020323 [Glycine max]
MVLEYLSLYPWVKQEVLKEVSLYSETILLEAVKNDLIFTFNGKDENIIVESCVREELVCVHVILRCCRCFCVECDKSLLSCGNNISGNESKVERFAINLDDDSDDDDYKISNSYVEDSFDEEEDIDDISDTDEEGGSGIAFWESASNYSNINWSHPDEEDIYGFDMGSTFNIGQELFVGMEFESKNALQQYVMKFHRVFWTFGQCKEAFKYCKPIMQVDCTFLYGKYRGTLLMATTQDGNGHVLPHAFVVVEGEKLTAWSWFLAHLREHVIDKEGYTPCKHIFDRNFDKFCDLSLAIKTWIDKISKEKWTIAYDRGRRRYGHMTTNLFECVNKVFRGCRNIPITALVKSTYNRCRQYLVDRNRKAQRELQSGQTYCLKVMKEIQKNQEKACSHIVRIYDIQRIMFEFEEAYNPMSQRGGKKWSVNLNDRYCQCGQFSTYHYPCSHIIVVCGVVSINFYQCIDVVYINDHILCVYSPPWWPLGNEDTIPPSDALWTLVPDPSFNRMKGRSRSTQLRNEMDWREPSQTHKKCGRCGVQGHNRCNCPLQSNQDNC